MREWRVSERCLIFVKERVRSVNSGFVVAFLKRERERFCEDFSFVVFLCEGVSVILLSGICEGLVEWREMVGGGKPLERFIFIIYFFVFFLKKRIQCKKYTFPIIIIYSNNILKKKLINT